VLQDVGQSESRESAARPGRTIPYVSEFQHRVGHMEAEIAGARTNKDKSGSGKGQMDEIVDVSTGEVKLGCGNKILRSVAIGSCIVISAYDSKNRIGALAHIMLPGQAPEQYAEKTRYADNGISDMIEQMVSAGSKVSDIEVCLVGAANVLKKDDDAVCRENIESTNRQLAQRQIPVRAAVLGGTERKGVSMDLRSGTIFYTEGDGPEQLLWKA